MLSEKRWQPMLVLMFGVLELLSFIGGALAAGISDKLLGQSVALSDRLTVGILASALGFQGMTFVWTHLLLKAHNVTWGEAFGFGQENIGSCVLSAVVALPIVFAGVFVLSKGSELALTALYHLWHTPWLEPKPQEIVQTLVDLFRDQRPWPLILAHGTVTVLMAPIAEEVIFRGILYPAMVQNGKRSWALVANACIFALVHGSPVNFLSFMLLATVLALVYERTQNLLTSILIHACFNGIMFSLIWMHPEWVQKVAQP